MHFGCRMMKNLRAKLLRCISFYGHLKWLYSKLLPRPKHKNDFQKKFFFIFPKWWAMKDHLNIFTCERAFAGRADRKGKNMSWNLIPTQKSPVSELKNIVKVKWLHKFLSIRIITDMLPLTRLKNWADPSRRMLKYNDFAVFPPHLLINDTFPIPRRNRHISHNRTEWRLRMVKEKFFRVARVSPSKLMAKAFFR